MSSACEYDLVIRQQPKQARMCSSDKDRRPIDPPPIIQLRGVSSPGSQSPNDDGPSFLENPYYFMFASLASPETGDAVQYIKDGTTPVLTGAAVSNLWHLQDPENGDADAGFFVFPELSVRSEGTFCLKLTLFEVQGASVRHCKSILSDPFVVYIPTKFPGMQVSTDLSCSLAEQGMKIRLRHDIRIGNKPTKRAAQQADHNASAKRGRKAVTSGGGGRKSKRGKVDNAHDDDHNDNAHASTSAPPRGPWGVIDPSLTDASGHPPPGYIDYQPPTDHAHAQYHPPAGSTPGPSTPYDYAYGHHLPHTHQHPHPHAYPPSMSAGTYPPGHAHVHGFPPPPHNGHHYPPSPPLHEYAQPHPQPDWYGHAHPQPQPQQPVTTYDDPKAVRTEAKEHGVVAPRRVLRARTRARAGTVSGAGSNG